MISSNGSAGTDAVDERPKRSRLASSILGALSRVTSSGRFITEIDGLRFIAIFAVVAFHTHNSFFPADPPVPHWGAGLKPVLSYVLHTGWFGVQLFFIISGFILAMPFAQHHLGGGPRVPLGRYLVRRLTRLEPPYLISLAVLVGLQMYFDGKDLRTLLPHFAAHAVYLHNVIYGSIDSPGFVAISHVTWSLEVEIQFYLLAPLLCLVFAIRGGRWPRRAAIVAGIVAGTLVQHYWWSPMLMSTLAGQIRWFLIGFLLADVYLTEWRSAPGKAVAWDVAGAIAWASWPFILPRPSLSEWLMPVVLLVAYMAAFRGRLLNRFFANPWIAVVGGMCYTIYLYHVALIWWVRRFLSAYLTGEERFDVLPWSLLQLLAVCAVVALASVPLFLIFEKPFMRWKGFRRRMAGGVLGATAALVLVASAAGLAQGRCMLTPGTPACNTTAIAPVFGPTGWKTVALEQITFRVADYRKEAAFYTALMGWKLRSDDGSRAVMDVGDWGTVIFAQADVRSAVVESFGFVIEPWNAARVEAELRTRGLTPIADNDGKGFESFHVKDPDGFDLQIANGNGLAKGRRTPPGAPSAPVTPFESTGWKTVWLDHFSFTVTNYKESASFYTNLLGWTPTYDEGSQIECLIGEVGDIIIRGGNPLDPGFGTSGRRGSQPGGAAAVPTRSARIDHISFGIAPWDTDGVKAELEKRSLRAQIDTSSRHQAPDGTWVPDDIHTAAFKSYHTQTPNGYNLQISYVTHDNRLALSNAVRPKGK